MRLLNQKQPGRFWREVAVCPVACASSMPYNHLALGQAGSKTPAAQHLRDVAQFGSAPALGAGCRRFESCRPDHICGRSSMVEPQPSKLMTRVRFPSPAPETTQVRALKLWPASFSPPSLWTPATKQPPYTRGGAGNSAECCGEALYDARYRSMRRGGQPSAPPLI